VALLSSYRPEVRPSSARPRRYAPRVLPAVCSLIDDAARRSASRA